MDVRFDRPRLRTGMERGNISLRRRAGTSQPHFSRESTDSIAQKPMFGKPFRANVHGLRMNEKDNQSEEIIVVSAATALAS